MECENAEENMKKSRKKRVVWTQEMESLLISIWEENAVDLRSSKKNSHVYMEMERAFNEGGLKNVSASEIKVKIANLSKMYRDEKRKVGSTGASPSEWHHYAAIHKIIGGNAFNNLSVRSEESFNYESPNVSMSSEDIFSDGQISSPPDTPSSPVVGGSSPVVVGIVEDTVPIEFIEPPKKKRKIELDSSVEVLREFSTEMIRIEQQRTEMFKESEQKRLELLAEKNTIAKERNELLKMLLEK